MQVLFVTRVPPGKGSERVKFESIGAPFLRLTCSNGLTKSRVLPMRVLTTSLICLLICAGQVAAAPVKLTKTNDFLQLVYLYGKAAVVSRDVV